MFEEVIPLGLTCKVTGLLAILVECLGRPQWDCRAEDGCVAVYNLTLVIEMLIGLRAEVPAGQ